MQDMARTLAIVVLNYNDAKTTEAFVRMALPYAAVDHIVVVDNRSTDDSFAVLQGLQSEKVDVICSDRNGGYGYGNNFGIRYASERYAPRYVLIANPDVQFENEMLFALMEALEAHEDAVIATAVMKNRAGQKEPDTAWKVPTARQYILSAELFIRKYCRMNRYVWLLEDTNALREVGCVAGSLLLADTEQMLRFGMYDERMFLYGEETYLGLKLQQAHKKTLLLQESYIHAHGVSIAKTFSSAVERKRMVLQSRLYLLEEYMGVRSLGLVLARLFYWLSLIELRLYVMLFRRSN